MEMSEFLDSQFENEEGRGRRKSLVSVKSIQRRIVGIRKDESSENHFNSNRHLVAVDHDLLASQSLTDVGDLILSHLLHYLYQMRLLGFSKWIFLKILFLKCKFFEKIIFRKKLTS